MIVACSRVGLSWDGVDVLVKRQQSQIVQPKEQKTPKHALWEDECGECLEFWYWNVNITTNHVILLIQFQEENIVSHHVHGAETHHSNTSKEWVTVVRKHLVKLTYRFDAFTKQH